MAREYSKVLKHQNINFSIIGRSEEHVKAFNREMKLNALWGGLNNTNFNKLKHNPEFAITA